MLLRELITPKKPQQLGRAFNHLEDLVFFHGSAGTTEALSHLKEFASQDGSNSIRMKWDGNPQIYWGREHAGGPLVLAGHNQWSRKVMATSAAEVEDFIVNQSGNPKTLEETQAREAFGSKFASLYDAFDKATPKDFVGYVYADGLFLDQPTPSNGIYSFSPNPRSETTYHVKQESKLGKQISNANIMVVGHARFDEYGAPDSSQQPITDFSMFDSNPNLIVMGPVYNTKPVKVNVQAINKIESYVQKAGKQIDEFLQPQKGLADLKKILYTYVNQTAKAKQLDNLSENHFFDWLADSKVSSNKQTKITESNQQLSRPISKIFELVKMVQYMKDDVIKQVDGEQGDIWDTNGEGRVRYANESKQFGNVKLVPRKQWTPG
jgi:hypothetical protein|tara:strand:+ start:4461 stop:5597 length:1137 start_codon:yes stop_codon:yes gene_type:complete